MSQKDLQRVDILSAISNTTPALKLQSRLGTRVERTGSRDERNAARREDPVQVERRVREGGGFRLRDRLGGAAVAAASVDQPQG
jgi:hypothetical protein